MSSPSDSPRSGRLPVVAVFDFDATITYADSFAPFLRETVGPVGFWSRLVLFFPILLAHALGLVSAGAAKQIAVRLFLRGRRVDRLKDEVAVRFRDTRLERLLNPAAIERLEEHLCRGDRVILLSASPELYLRVWAAERGVREVLGTKLQIIDGRLTGALDGYNCKGEEKVHRLTDHLGPLINYRIYAYGDSPSDCAHLNLVAHPFYRSFDSARGIRRRWVIARALLKALR